ncbi:hypothetical protein A0130_09850 [Leifsonia xyli]|nr:hypothetical protein A0130_09850 [Leifsonia xyli]
MLPYAIPFEVNIAGEAITIRQSDRLGIPLQVEGHTILRLDVRYRCTWNTAGAYFAVEYSSFTVQPASSSAPLFTYDYLRKPGSLIPCSHINVHAHRDEIVAAMMLAGKRHKGKARAKQIEKAQVPTLSALHFPVGGHRFRPCLEDVLQMLIVEFGIDTQERYQAVLDAGRSEWRTTQLRTAITDDMELAAELLREHGYVVSDRQPEAATRRHERFTAY